MRVMRRSGSSAVSRKPRICFVGPDNHNVLMPGSGSVFVGGESVQHVLLGRAFRDQGFDVSMLVKACDGPIDTTIDGMRVLQAFEHRPAAESGSLTRSRFPGMWAAMRTVDADVYYQSPAGAFTGLAALFCRRHRRRFVFRVASDVNCIPGKQLIRKWRYRKFYEFGLKRADVVAVQSKKQQQLAAENYRVEAEIVNMVVESPRATSGTERDIDVLWINNHRDVKRPEWVLEIARSMPGYRFAMIGGANPGWEADYERCRDDAQSIENLEFVGPVPYSEVNDYVDRARVFLNTSYVEGFPNSFLQAWIRGVPVVGSFDPDGVITSRELGRKADTVAELAKDLDEILGDAALRERYSANARRFTEQYTGAAVVERYLELLGPGLTDRKVGDR